MSKKFIQQVKFNETGLIPVIVQQFDSGEVLTLAWMNEKAITETISGGRMCYWSRSRQQLWYKGEKSGQTQQLKELILDCDGDSLLAKVDQKGVACHTGRKSCFFLQYKNGETVEIMKPEISPEELYGNKDE